MTPQEKARELYNKFRNEFPVMSRNIKGKQCALIAVEEILNNNCGSHMSELEIADKNEIYCDEYFWQNVKDEIKKL